MNESHCPEATCDEMVAGINRNVNGLIIWKESYDVNNMKGNAYPARSDVV